MTSDSRYYVSSQDWPAGATDQEELPLDEVYAVLGEFDKYYEMALEGLARVQVPPVTAHGSGNPAA